MQKGQKKDKKIKKYIDFIGHTLYHIEASEICSSWRGTFIKQKDDTPGNVC